ncbi:hypothetical protein [Mycolicibacterium mucogenicum]|nr:hypothetical protein [Mycolicibacterium mucogenicum]
MKELATEVEFFWDGGAEIGGVTTWSRELPDRRLAIIADGYEQTRLIVQGRTIDEYEGLAEAVHAAGQIARAILSAQMQEWGHERPHRSQRPIRLREGTVRRRAMINTCG